jgi:hypothetical protein
VVEGCGKRNTVAPHDFHSDAPTKLVFSFPHIGKCPAPQSLFKREFHMIIAVL